jgi:hypothetical protein
MKRAVHSEDIKIPVTIKWKSYLCKSNSYEYSTVLIRNVEASTVAFTIRETQQMILFGERNRVIGKKNVI